MNGRVRLRLAGALVAGLTGFAALATGHLRACRAEREYAVRAARTAAAYLALVTPTEESGYDLSQLLAQARGLAGLPGWAGAIEVYHGTAPLVRATVSPLPPAVLEQFREGEIEQALGDAMLVPLKDRNAREVVGAVAVQARGIAPPLLGHGTLLLLVILLAAGAIAADEKRRLRVIGGATLCAALLGLAGYRQAVSGVRTGTDRWLVAARAAMEAAAARRPPVRPRVAASRLAPLALDGELAPGDSGPTTARRSVVAGLPRAEIHVRLPPRGWLTLRAPPEGATAGRWLAATLGISLLSPIGLLLLAWLAQPRARPRALQETLAA